VQDSQRVGGVVDDFPTAGHDRDKGIFEKYRNPHAAEKLQVPLRDVGITVLTGVVVMEDVVLVVPGFGQEPVEPVDKAPPAAGEDLTRVAAGNARNAVVSAVQNVMREQPAGELPETEQKGAEWIGDHPGRGIAQKGGGAAIPLDPLQVGEVGRSDARMDLGLQSVDGSAESGDVDAVEFSWRRRLGSGCHREQDSRSTAARHPGGRWPAAVPQRFCRVMPIVAAGPAE